MGKSFHFGLNAENSMALEYTLYLVTELKPKEIVEIVFKSIGLHYQIEDSTESDRVTFTTESGFILYAKYASQLQCLLIKEELDLEPRLHLLLRLDKFENRAIVKKQLIFFIKSILQKTYGDCVALFNHEEVLLIRRSGEININQNSSFWNSDYLELLNEPYKTKFIDDI